ncbi:YceI family protein [Plastoroseomonas arctica]|uniref:YceI family protein n=1 Tax=Plastoroseomonas arctica TaxID=1509237 RepID=A0AAF1KPB2_9PROT|nr:YceI family protein [Plastoroseomonas arctica]MBR0657254.1 YceI family protein [Plastoroseomonas arctica]
MLTGRRGALAMGVVALAAPARAQQRNIYAFNQDRGVLSFSARHFGMLASTGRFEKFDAVVRLDPQRTGTAQVEVEVETGSIAMGYAGAVEMLRSEAYFDTAHHPKARFRGAATGAGQATGFPILGTLTVKGIERPLTMQARLVGQEREAGSGREIATFQAEGTMLRSQYGMVADAYTISDRITLGVTVQLFV